MGSIMAPARLTQSDRVIVGCHTRFKAIIPREFRKCQVSERLARLARFRLWPTVKYPQVSSSLRTIVGIERTRVVAGRPLPAHFDPTRWWDQPLVLSNEV